MVSSFVLGVLFVLDACALCILAVMEWLQLTKTKENQIGSERIIALVFVSISIASLV